MILTNNQYIGPYVFTHIFCKFKENCPPDLPLNFGVHEQANSFHNDSITLWQVQTNDNLNRKCSMNETHKQMARCEMEK
jgi:hypothetical protein